MAYRGAIGPRIACAAHAAAEAIGTCSRCRVPLCDPCTLYFAADPYCRVCVGPARRSWMARIVAGVAGVMLVMALGSGVMLAAIPSHLHGALTATTPIVRHPENCRPVDQWLVDARHDLTQNRPHVALRDIALSRRDCGPDSERYRLEGLAYQRIGDELSAIAAFRNYGDETGDYEPLRGANLDAERRAADAETEHAAAMRRQLDILQAQLEAATRAAEAATSSAIGDFPVARPIPVSQDITTPVGSSLPRIVTVPRDDDGRARIKPRF